MDSFLSVYQEHGYNNRQDYLQGLADEYGLNYADVVAIASLLGEAEDFDALVIELEDFSVLMAE